MGRPRTPTLTLQTRGSRHAQGRTEPPPLPGKPRTPPGLSDTARRAWRYYAKLLETTGVLQRLDGAALELLACTYATWRECEDLIAREGMTYVAESGLVKKNPTVSIRAEAAAQLTRLLQQFGLTPASRSNVSPPTGPAADDPAGKSRFFGGRKVGGSRKSV